MWFDFYASPTRLSAWRQTYSLLLISKVVIIIFGFSRALIPCFGVLSAAVYVWVFCEVRSECSQASALNGYVESLSDSLDSCSVNVEQCADYPSWLAREVHLNLCSFHSFRTPQAHHGHVTLINQSVCRVGGTDVGSTVNNGRGETECSL